MKQKNKNKVVSKFQIQIKMNGCSEFTTLFCPFINSTYQSMDKLVEIKWQKFSLNKNSKKKLLHLKFIYSIFIDTHTQIKNPKHVDEEDKDNLPEGE